MERTRRYRVAILDDYQDAARRYADWSPVERDADIAIFRDTVADVDRLVERLEPFHVVCAMRERTRFNAEVLKRLPNLRLIASTGSWNAAIDVDAAHACGITVSGTEGGGSATPEFTWALILAAARHIPDEVASVRRGGWQTAVGADLKGRVLGILGLGRIGREVAAVGQAFGMEVIAWSQNLREDDARAFGVRRVEREALFSLSDVLTIHLKLSPRTTGLVDAAALAAMKPSAILVNTSRGPIVDEQALVDALAAGRPAMAALDVYDVEPLPTEHRLRSLPNLITTPHIGYVTEQTYRVFYGQTVDNIRNWMDGKPSRIVGPST
jgi:phosphoglycerate dehydrogenase-like enzyme